ncbi:hypothetical protein IP90_01163 [Luteimonas cucumeris]|uniref:Uncharacterized protein n=1 Tax=Luteimonas cucumeris TaxID=985012 RepID=A0A562LBK7_9GAMM|nr:hypothetical protein [Luteimonas cucumeris]TWI05021.1 hypothetical protein IP90_01163 [Luteimonas cucumeris]
MNFTSRLMLVACLVLPFAACKKEEASKEAVVTAPVAKPSDDNDKKAWQAYLKDIAIRNMAGITNPPFAYILPAESSPDFAGEYERLLERTQADVGRGIIEGNMLVFGSPASAKMADIIIESFKTVPPGSMKGVKVLYVGTPADNERVKAVVEPSGVEYVFVEAK